jgi:hypothetical protein
MSRRIAAHRRGCAHRIGSLQEETGYLMDYVGDKVFFPAPPEPLIAA